MEIAYVTLRVFATDDGEISIKAETDLSETATVVNILKKAVTLLDQDTPDEVEQRTEETTVETYRSRAE